MGFCLFSLSEFLRTVIAFFKFIDKAIAAVLSLLLVLKRLLIHTRFEYQWSNIDIEGTFLT